MADEAKSVPKYPFFPDDIQFWFEAQDDMFFKGQPQQLYDH